MMLHQDASPFGWLEGAPRSISSSPYDATSEIYSHSIERGTVRRAALSRSPRAALEPLYDAQSTLTERELDKSGDSRRALHLDRAHPAYSPQHAEKRAQSTLQGDAEELTLRRRRYRAKQPLHPRDLPAAAQRAVAKPPQSPRERLVAGATLQAHRHPGIEQSASCSRQHRPTRRCLQLPKAARTTSSRVKARVPTHPRGVHGPRCLARYSAQGEQSYRPDHPKRDTGSPPSRRARRRCGACAILDARARCHSAGSRTKKRLSSRTRN